MTVKARAEGVLFALTLVWGSTFVVGKVILEGMTPLQMISLRFVTASVILLAFFRRSIFPLRRDQAVKGGILGLLLFVGFVTQTIGLTVTTASKSAFVTGMMVVFVPLLQIAVVKKSPKLGNFLGVLIVMAGLWFLTSPAGASFNVGDALTLVCALLFALYIVYLGIIAGDMSPIQLTFMQMATNAVLSLGAFALFDRTPLRLTEGSFVAIVYLTLFATVITTFLQTKFQKDTTPTRAVVIFSCEPVWASILAAFFLSERLGTGGMIGGALIISGILVSELSDAIPVLNRSFDLAGGGRTGEG
jgi:drug/metabolite transporter (DMT)-like permease